MLEARIGDKIIVEATVTRLSIPDKGCYIGGDGCTYIPYDLITKLIPPPYIPQMGDYMRFAASPNNLTYLVKAIVGNKAWLKYEFNGVCCEVISTIESGDWELIERKSDATA